MNDEYIKKLAKRNQQRAKKLIARPDFQKEVKQLRKKWEIPLDGISSEKLKNDWQEHFVGIKKNWYENVWYKRRNELIKLKKKGKIFESNELQKKINDTNPVNALRIDIKNLLKKYHLSLLWKDGIKNYLLSNKLENIVVPVGLTIITKQDEDIGVERAYIEIDDSLTLQTIKKSWKYIMYFRDQLNSKTQKKFQPIKRFDRDKEAYELHKKGKTAQEIADILSEKEDKIYSYEDVFSFIKRHKTRIGIN